MTTSKTSIKSMNTVYDDKIQMIMDFLKLSFIIDNPKSSLNQKRESITLQKNLLNMIKNNNIITQTGGSINSVSNIGKICPLLEEIYQKNELSIRD